MTSRCIHGCYRAILIIKKHSKIHLHQHEPLDHSFFCRHSSTELEEDQSDCIDVQDRYEIQKKPSSRVSKKRGRPKKKQEMMKITSKSKSQLKPTKTTTLHTLNSFHDKKELSKKDDCSHSTKSFEPYTKDYSDTIVLKTPSVELAKKTPLLTPYSKYKKFFEKSQQNMNNSVLSKTIKAQEFPHLFKPAPKLPVETKNGQRLARKYRKKYTTGDLRYVHVHRQDRKSKIMFSDIHDNKQDDLFDILSLVPREVIPAITSNSQLGFREAIIDKRLMRYKRGVPIFRIGRKIPGELS